MFYGEFTGEKKQLSKYCSELYKKIIQTYKCEKKYGKLADATKLSLTTKNFDGGGKK